MDIKEIKQVIDLMKRSDLIEFEIEEEGLKLRIKRDGKNDPVPTTVMLPQQAPVIQAGASSMASVPAPAPEPAAKADPAGTHIVKSPMVGTFYRAPNPDSPAFVDVGARVTSDSVVCIIEAMKVMNEINAETEGQIVEILVENGQSVEFGQPLFKVRK